MRNTLKIWHLIIGGSENFVGSPEEEAVGEFDEEELEETTGREESVDLSLGL